MKKTLYNEFGLSRGAKLWLVVMMTGFLFVSAFLYGKLYNKVRETVADQAVGSVTNISQLNADSVSRSLKNRQVLLETFAENLSMLRSDNWDFILSRMKPYVQSYDFANMGILTEDMQLRLTTGDVFDVSSISWYQDAWNEEFHISSSFMDQEDKYRVNLLSVPVYYEEGLAYVITAACYSKDLTARINTNSLNGKGYNFLLDKEGNVVIYPKEYQDDAYLRLMEYINRRPETIPDETGDVRFVYKQEKYYAHFEKLEVNDWYLMTCLKEKDVFSDSNLIMKGILLVMSILWVQILAALGFSVYLFVRSKERIQKAVFYDQLLGIENGEYLRVFFGKIPEEQLDDISMVALDVDKFKEFNYIYGEEAGDELLKYIARVLKEELPGDKVFHHLADLFIVLIRCADRAYVSEKMNRVLQRFAKDMEDKVIQPFDISAGIRRIKKGESFQRIMSDALLAKGTVKGIQLQQYAFYDENLRYRRMSYMEMESDFYRALREGEFQAYYQPKYHMETGEIIGAEALVRWVKKDGTVIGPGTFIPCFEASRQIILLDETMLESVCRQMKDMENEGLAVRRVSVNLSRVHLRHHGILQKIERIIQETKVDPGMLSFEITESALYEDSIPLQNIVDHLHRLGCRVDMDDYGMGVSGPKALATNDFDTVKLDKSFISAIGDKKIESVIQSTIRLSKELGMEIIAEGVEEKSQAETLVKWGCPMGQGYYFSPPVSEREYRRMLREGKKKNL